MGAPSLPNLTQSAMLRSAKGVHRNYQACKIRSSLGRKVEVSSALIQDTHFGRRRGHSKSSRPYPLEVHFAMWEASNGLHLAKIRNGQRL
jgi:hypothetical protein